MIVRQFALAIERSTLDLQDAAGFRKRFNASCEDSACQYHGHNIT